MATLRQLRAALSFKKMRTVEFPGKAAVSHGLVQERNFSDSGSGTKYGIQGTSFMIPLKGEPAEKFPKKMKVEKGKSYKWCACGHSVRQPFCDGSHKRVGLTTLRPVEYIPETDKQVSWCQCKLTANRPFCDGSHKKLPEGPLNTERSRNYLAFDQFEEIVEKGVAKKLGLKTRRGWVV